MPLYEYACEKCGRVVEVLQRMSDSPFKNCDQLGEDRPECKGGGQLNKQMSRTSFQLKGDGWYITDYARKDKKNKESSSGEKTSGGDSGGDTKSPKTGSDNKVA